MTSLAAQPVIKFYSSWFCPYAQRAWIALNQLELKYEWVEALKFNEKHEYIKDENLLRVNPKGLVPTLEVNNEIVVESIDTVEYLYKHFGDGVRNVVTTDLVQDAHNVNKTVASPYYAFLLKQEISEQDCAWDNFVGGLKAFTKHIEPDGFFKSPYMNIVDITLFPWAIRLDLVEELRGRHLDKRDAWVQEFYSWFDRMLSFKSVRDTMPDKKELIKISQRYAKGTAKSKMADAVRSGREAHDLE